MLNSAGSRIRKQLMHARNVAWFVAVFLFVSSLTGPLHAYLDPGTGSMIIQLVLGVSSEALRS